MGWQQLAFVRVLTMTRDETAPLRPPLEDLRSGDVSLRLERIVPGDAAQGHVPYYHFRVLDSTGNDVGHINFRVGDTDHIRNFAGHIGFRIEERSRGHGYARQACNALAPLVRNVYESVLITCDVDNAPSQRTIERLGATLIDQIQVPANDPSDATALKWKRRYSWKP